MAIDEQTQVRVVAGEREQVLRGELAAELLGENLGVLGTDLEGAEAADVAENGIAGRLVHLRQVLVGNREVQAILAGLGEDRRECFRGVVLEFIDVEIEVGAVGLCGVGPAHGGELDARDEEGAEQRRGVLADAALAEIHEQHLALVHDASQVQRRLRLADDISQHRARRKRPNLIEHRRQGFSLLLLVPTREFPLPEGTDDRVGNAMHDARAEGLIGEEA